MVDIRLPADLAWVFLIANVVDAQHSLRRVTLKNYETKIHGEGVVPVFVHASDAQTDAVEFSDLTPQEAARIRYLLAVLTGFDVTELPVGAAPVVDGATEELPRNWTHLAGRILAATLPEVLAWQDRKSPAKVAQMLPMMRMRAWSLLQAQAEPARDMGQRPTDAPIIVDHKRHAYADFFALNEYDLAFPRFDGSYSGQVTRGVFNSCDATLVLPYDPARDRVLLVEQFRAGAFARGAENPWVMEAIAGLVDAGETPETTAHREAMEEAGLHLKSLEVISHSHPSPAANSEFYHIFIGIADLPDDAAGLGGLASEAEDIRSHILSYDDFIARVDADQFSAGPLVLMALWLARHRDRLRRSLG